MFEIVNWIIWLILVILWNYCYPYATPFQDVLVAVLLSLLFIFIKKIQLANSKGCISLNKLI